MEQISFSQLSEGSRPAIALNLDFQFGKLEDNKFLLFNPPPTPQLIVICYNNLSKERQSLHKIQIPMKIILIFFNDQRNKKFATPDEKTTKVSERTLRR